MTDHLSHIVSLDLGKMGDPSALAVVERASHPGGVFYALRHLQRWKLGTPYTAPAGTPNVVDDTLALLTHGSVLRPTLVLDATGVGAAVVDMFKWRVKCVFRPLVITGGENARRDPRTGAAHVPKKDLAGTLQALYGTRRLVMAAGLADLDALVAEIAAFKARVTKTGHDAYEAMGAGAHDDLVMALAMALWVGECCHGGEIDNEAASTKGASMYASAPEGVWEVGPERERGRYDPNDD